MNYWLVKTEPDTYSWDDFVTLGRDHWDGVRNYAARKHMKEMKIDDLVLFYHSNKGKDVVGIAKVVKEFYQDPTTDDDRWVVVDLEPVKKLQRGVTLQEIKDDERLKDIALVKLQRLSVQPVPREAFHIIIEMSEK
ncbi:EVE domain-containing protein [uncultured Arcticibacterium sp.]|uniref:EVE domain-containing protein n=1 Tax=uncultured Arcticibacterium sp. TaxID=2173042 RepID=UPI0030F663F0